MKRWVPILIPLWILSLASGIGALAAYANTPGSVGQTHADWPWSASDPDGLARTHGAWTLVLGVHPRCPCTRATRDELRAALEQAGRGTARPHELIVLVFDAPGDANPLGQADFADTDLTRTLAALPGASIVRDPHGERAAELGIHTSGHLLAYDPGGVLRLSGGLTPSRGHVGPNTGVQALRALLTTTDNPAPEKARVPGGVATPPVFGCPLCPTTGTQPPSDQT